MEVLLISVTLKDIARKTGFSTATISLVLNSKPASIPETTRKKILDTANELGYIPKKKSPNIALLVPNLRNPFFSELAGEILSNTKKHQFNLIISDSNADTENDIQDLLSFLNAGVSGIIAFFSTGRGQDARLRQIIRQITEVHHIPLILMDRNKPEYNCDAVCVNQFSSGYLATAHLLQMGHTRIGCIAGPDYSEAGQQRLEGYRSALEESGVPYDPELVFYSNFSFEAGYRNLEPLLEKQVSAIFTQSDFIALGVYRRAQELHVSIPQDLSIVGLDNVLYTTLVIPPLTSVAQDIPLTARLAVETLVARIQGTANPNRNIQILQPQLVQRESVCRYRPKH
ncbi:MAG: LacI family transcriptional regulator [Lachnospiraceae bacterium]|nr:LacI family transcriptional regulator [Lachnospiraceae bacterium]